MCLLLGRLNKARGALAVGAPQRRGAPTATGMPEEDDCGGGMLFQVPWPLRMPQAAPEGPQGPPTHNRSLPSWARCCCLALLGAPSPLFPLVAVCSCTSGVAELQQQQEPLREVYVHPQEVLLGSACCSNSSNSRSSNGCCCPAKERPFFAVADLRCRYEALLPLEDAATAAAAGGAAAAACEIGGPWKEALTEIAG